MIKNICTLFVLLYTITTFGQNVILIKNTNPKAKELKQSLNTTKDSLFLASENKILKVEIFNEDYEKMTIVEDFETRISLKDLPPGKFVVEARLIDKIILLDIVKRDYSNENTIAMLNVTEGKGMMLDEDMKVIKNAPNYSLESILTGRKPNQQSNKKPKFYWIVVKVNNESGSCKTMRLVDQQTADRMILKHQRELKSEAGKLNELTVWEVYNTSEFMAQQISNPEYFYSPTSEVFNTIPYFTTKNQVANL